MKQRRARAPSQISAQEPPPGDFAQVPHAIFPDAGSPDSLFFRSERQKNTNTAQTKKLGSPAFAFGLTLP